MKNIVLYLALLVCLYACNNQQPIANPEDYNQYLDPEIATQKDALSKQLTLWNSKLDKDSIRIVPLGTLAKLYTQRFESQGTITDLKKAEAVLLKAVEIAAIKKANYLSALTRNYISQHRFREAWEALDEAEKYGALPRTLSLQRFDVAMELGYYTEAKKQLDQAKDFTDFDFLIRLAKWKDHEGDLDNAIFYMEAATEIAEKSSNKSLLIWSYTNLGDFYGHDGRISQAYENYLKTLALDPANAYAKKGIAWIAFSNDKNIKEAKRIVQYIMQNHQSPDYTLLLSEIAAYEGDKMVQENHLNSYLRAVAKPEYGVMYTSYLAQLLAEEKSDFDDALKLAQQEVLERPTPQSYGLLAYILQMSGAQEKALDVVETHLNKDGLEPAIGYQIATVYKANDKKKQLQEIKKELLQSAFELGPIMTTKIEAL